MMKGSHGQKNQLRDINWGALDHASCAPQLMSRRDYYVCMCECVCARSLVSVYVNLQVGVYSIFLNSKFDTQRC